MPTSACGSSTNRRGLRGGARVENPPAAPVVRAHARVAGGLPSVPVVRRQWRPASPAWAASPPAQDPEGDELPVPTLRASRPPAVRRLAAAALAAAALTAPALLLAAPAATAAPATTTEPAPAAAGYLARQLVGGTHYVFDFDGTTPDQGLTADGVFGMSAAKTSGTAIAAAAGWLAANSAGYIDAGNAFGGPFPGSYAKLALVAEVTGADPHAFGGVDLLANLRALECPATGRAECAGTAGLFRNATPDGGYPNVVTQSLAILALVRSPRPADRPSDAAVDVLVGQQCVDGGFPSLFPTGGAACVSDVDGTGFAAQALVAAGRTAATTSALDWLTSVRRPDGSFVGNGTPNSNSTALAVQALAAGGRDATASVAWLRSRQVGCAGPAAQRGAVTYAGTFDATALRATAQAALGLAAVPLTTVTAAGAAPEAAVLACASPSPTASPTASPTGSPTAAPTSPRPGLPATSGIDGIATAWLAGIGGALVAAGAVALLATRRRA